MMVSYSLHIKRTRAPEGRDDSGSRQEKYKMNLKHFVVLSSKEAVKDMSKGPRKQVEEHLLGKNGTTGPSI